MKLSIKQVKKLYYPKASSDNILDMVDEHGLAVYYRKIKFEILYSTNDCIGRFFNLSNPYVFFENIQLSASAVTAIRLHKDDEFMEFKSSYISKGDLDDMEKK